MTYALELRNISKSFEHKHVLKDLSFAIEPGKIIGYIGPNGAGKSTCFDKIGRASCRERV